MMYWRAQLRVSVIRGSRVRAVSSRVTVGEDESVSVEPLGVLGREVHVSGPEDVSSRSHALRVSMVRHHLLETHHGRTRVSRVGLQISIARGGACDAATHLGDDIGGKGSDGAGD